MTATAETLVERLNLSGFIGFDFILDAAGHAWLLESLDRINRALRATNDLDRMVGNGKATTSCRPSRLNLDGRQRSSMSTRPSVGRRNRCRASGGRGTEPGVARAAPSRLITHTLA